ncbi:hypothetical protein Cob_v007927 [Colletotrichum orbiculare MAFF 240422]|uniref:Uncharacterized protein n=1 Tax=Colletotrichum orbiculare (strain 104-T / ATCC 96160 / CBS 514.97 / LARS 414 / MAFF 240422) TaxID=1213857 RepID=A0A484FL26_COLOR|nr:hypothetical protein Cob_v007927 [Colletotrichum orbiculare MAFF 240422]
MPRAKKPETPGRTRLADSVAIPSARVRKTPAAEKTPSKKTALAATPIASKPSPASSSRAYAASQPLRRSAQKTATPRHQAWPYPVSQDESSVRSQHGRSASRMSSWPRPPDTRRWVPEDLDPRAINRDSSDIVSNDLEGLGPILARFQPSRNSASKSNQDTRLGSHQSDVAGLSDRVYAAASFRVSNGPVNDALIQKAKKALEELFHGCDVDPSTTAMVSLDD